MMRTQKGRVRVRGEGTISGSTGDGMFAEKGETFQKEKWKGKERKHFRRRSRKERSGNILEGEMERKGRKGNILQRRRKERKIRKEEKACRGSRSDVAGYGGRCLHYYRGPAYWGL